MVGKAIQKLKNELWLLHVNDEAIWKALVGKLSFAVNETIKRIVDGERPTEETVKELIDMKKLAHGNNEVQKTEENRKQYAAAVLRACEVTIHCEHSESVRKLDPRSFFRITFNFICKFYKLSVFRF